MMRLWDLEYQQEEEGNTDNVITVNGDFGLVFFVLKNTLTLYYIKSFLFLPV